MTAKKVCIGLDSARIGLDNEKIVLGVVMLISKALAEKQRAQHRAYSNHAPESQQPRNIRKPTGVEPFSNYGEEGAGEAVCPPMAIM